MSLLREADRAPDLTRRLADCFENHRSQERVERPVWRLVGLVLGGEDLNDHDELRDDSLLALTAGCDDLTGENRVRERDRGHPLASSKTLNRLELGVPGEPDRYKKADMKAMDELMVDLFLEAPLSKEIFLDLDSTDDPLHVNQEGRFFHGYYGCYLPLYVVCGNHVLCSRLRPSNVDGAAGSVEELARIVERIPQALAKNQDRRSRCPLRRDLPEPQAGGGAGPLRETLLRSRGERNQGAAICSPTGRRPRHCSPAPLLCDFRRQRRRFGDSASPAPGTTGPRSGEVPQGCRLHLRAQGSALVFFDLRRNCSPGPWRTCGRRRRRSAVRGSGSPPPPVEIADCLAASKGLKLKLRQDTLCGVLLRGSCKILTTLLRIEGPHAIVSGEISALKSMSRSALHIAPVSSYTPKRMADLEVGATVIVNKTYDTDALAHRRSQSGCHDQPKEENAHWTEMPSAMSWSVFCQGVQARRHAQLSLST